MTYTGRVTQGVVVFDGSARPPEGSVVRVEAVSFPPDQVGEALDRLAGLARGLPADLAKRHDDYRRERSS